jgi:hypothetical protein
MDHKNDQVLIGARIPLPLKEELTMYCLHHGIKMNHFVTKAIREKLTEMAAEKTDVLMAKKRLTGAEFINETQFNQLLARKRKSKK